MIDRVARLQDGCKMKTCCVAASSPGVFFGLACLVIFLSISINFIGGLFASVPLLPHVYARVHVKSAPPSAFFPFAIVF